MKTVFGVNSIVRADTRLKNGYTMYDWVMRMKCFPAFWGRTLFGENVITREEMHFLKEKRCRVALIMRDLTEIEVSGIDGAPAAYRAIYAAKALGVPQNAAVCLFAEIKPTWSINHNWMIGFAKTLAENGFVPGFIGNTDSSQNFNFDRQCSHFVQATRATDGYGAIYCATEPKREGAPVKWMPYCPSALSREDIHLWECDTLKFDDLEVKITYMQNLKTLQHMWEVKNQGGKQI